MPVVNSSSSLPVQAAESGFTVFTVNYSLGLSAVFNGKTAMNAVASGGQPLVTFAGKTTISATLLPLMSDEPIVFAGSTDFDPLFYLINHENYELRFAISITAASETSNYRKLWMPRLKVDGTEIPILSANYQETSGSIGASLSARLARPSDKSVFIPGAIINFGIGQKIAGVWDETTFDTIFSTGEISGRSHSIGWNSQDRATTDSVEVNINSDISAKFAVTPRTDCVIYDSTKQTLNQSDFETLYDTEGRPYLTELKAIPGMTLYDLLHEVVVVRCGFASYSTNLPDFPIARVDAQMGKGWMESIRGVLGVFSPAMFADDATSTLWVVDASATLPAGFPASRTVAIDDYRALQLTDSQAKLDGFIVQYTEDKRAFDYVTTRVETETRTSGTFPNADYTTTFIEKGFREYRRLAQPGLVLRDELYYEKQTVSGAFNDISETTENYTFDELGRMTLREKTVLQRLPDLDTNAFAMTEAQAESESISYAAHPYRPRAQYISRRVTEVTGLIVTDSANQQLGQDYKTPFIKGYRNGNLSEGQTSATGAISTRIETAEPKRDGQVTLHVKEIDHISNSIMEDTRDDRAGDVAIYGTQPAQSRVLVLDDENALRTTERIETLSVGELPMSFAVPLARRILKRRKTKMHTGSPDVIGYESGIRKGLPITLTGRDGEALGNYLVIGRTITAGRDGANMRLEVMEI